MTTIPSTACLPGVGRSRPSEDAETIAAEAAAQLEQVQVRRHLFGPATVVNDVVAQINVLHAAAASGSARQARMFRYLEARYAEYLSWLAEEMADQKAMHEWLALAVELGSDSGDPAIAGYAAIRRAATALRADDPDAALRHVRCALSNPELPPRLRSIALQRESRARARHGDREGFRRAIDAFYDLSDDTSAPATQDWEWGPKWDPLLGSSRLTEATGLMELEEFRTAAEVFASTMPHTFPEGQEASPSLRHARVCFAIREATTYAHVHECDRAADVIESFLQGMPDASVTVRYDLRRLASILSRRRASRLRALTPDILALAQSTLPNHRTKQLEARRA